MSDPEYDQIPAWIHDPAPQALRDKAEEMYGSDEVEFDDVAFQSEAGTGVWVSAWVWIPHDDEEE